MLNAVHDWPAPQNNDPMKYWKVSIFDTPGISLEVPVITASFIGNRVSCGYSTTSKGCVSLTFFSTPEGEVKLAPLDGGVFSGYRAHRTTFQSKGAFTLSLEWRTGETSWTVQSWDGKNYESPLNRWILKNKQNFLKYFREVSRGGHPCPGSLWDLKDLQPLRKEARAANFSRIFGVPVPGSHQISPRSGLNYRPVPAPEGWKEWVPSIRRLTGSVVDIDDCSTFYWSDGKGKGEEVKAKPDIDSRSNYAHSTSYFDDGETIGSIIRPVWAKYLVSVREGAYERNHHSYGVAVDVYTL